MRRSLAVCGLAAAFLGLGTSPALAGGDDSGKGEWVPIEQLQPDYYTSFDVAACGSTVTVAPGDVRSVQVRERTRADGTVVRDYRGGATVDLTRQSDGATIDELDISGPGRDVVSPDGSAIDVTLHGASILYPVPGEERYFAEAGLPALAWFGRGVVTVHITSDPDTQETTSERFDVHARVVDLCRWFDRPGAHHASAHQHGPSGRHTHADRWEHAHG